MTKSKISKRRAISAPRFIAEEPPRLCMIPGLCDRAGEPLIVRATGSRRRPLLMAFASIAAAVASGSEAP
ncbi:hypothetical protein EJV46_16095 [Roseococcus sp. SYP-B2431]|uniref:hypothetical protein n=1 Tax=Roseococcus sp. SYP-B2431 TaxID=2496640 RepID=UPI00103C03FF|nr:hypothetical protein [Roseococcus sp. SYP-B2431]TCH97638.1 hypothetical protein EJV46_16095 [Roseococcus sp. SYP-B2431]